MASAGTRLAALLVGALLAAVAAGGGSGTNAAGAAGGTGYARSLDGQVGSGLRADRLARVAATWRGGPITASTGEVVNVLVSDSLPVETPEKWAEFLASLTHGPELSLLTTSIGTLQEVQDVCGGRALGCYFGNEMVAFGEPVIDGTTAEEVVRHEYGHHVAYHRVNPPWIAIDWGPKNWASAATVCPRVARREAFPGDEGRNYAQNPGEAWAETYRLMDERKAGITTATWPIIAPSFYPSEAALVAAERDVVQPWTKGSTTASKRVFGKKTKKVWWIPLATPLDGELRLSALVPNGGLHEVALVAANRTTVLARGQWVSQRLKRVETTVCGQRSLFVRVTQKGALGRVTVTVSAP
jgi:hypothetical protein